MSAERLSAALGERLREAGVSAIGAMEVFESLDSTNAQLMNAESTRSGQMSLCLALTQTAGRGRRGRSWVSPVGRGLYLSAGWTFSRVRQDLSTLSLAIGVAVKRALEALGARDVRLKWPNDVVVANGKLGGILIEMRSLPEGAYVVIGIGINLRHPPDFASVITALGGQEPRDLVCAGIAAPDWLDTAAAVIAQLSRALPQFEQDGLQSFAEEWRAADSLRGCAVEWSRGDERYQGVARGIEADGALLVESETGVERLISGDVTLRRVA